MLQHHIKSNLLQYCSFFYAENDGAIRFFRSRFVFELSAFKVLQYKIWACAPSGYYIALAQ